MSEIDWNDELEAYHKDGRVVAMTLNPAASDVKATRMTMSAPDPEQSNVYWEEDGRDCVYGSGWRIRNRQSTPSTDRLARLEAFVARVSEGGLLAVGFHEEAKALVAELNPVDPLLIKARRIALDEWQPSAWDDKEWEKRVMAGDEDEDRAVRSAYSALRQARKEGNDNGK